MKFIKQFSSDTEMNTAISQIKHKDGAFLFGVSTINGIKNIGFCDHIHPGPNCLMLGSVNMSPVKLDSSSTKKTPAVADVLYSTTDGKLTLDAQTNNVDNIPIAICVIPEVMENFKNGDDSTGAVKTARFVSLNYMNCDTPTAGSDHTQYIRFGNYSTFVGNIKGIKENTEYIGGKWNTQQCLSKATKQDQNICGKSIANKEETGYCAPVCCCVAYSTPGTKPGDWYLPTIGELYQIYVNKTAINEKHTDIKGNNFNDNGSYWTSRESSSDAECILKLRNGIWTSTDKFTTAQVLAFLALEY